MPTDEELQLLNHSLEEESAFLPETLIEAVRRDRGAKSGPIPRICVLDFDGDLTDRLVHNGRSSRSPSWSCFHTTMEEVELEGAPVGVVGRTIGGPYAVLIAEQMLSQGAEVIVGLTSAGRISPALPLPSLVVPTDAVRDEGTSFHYLPPGSPACAPQSVVDALSSELQGIGLPVTQGRVWTTDAPYRETASQIERHAAAGVLAVEMQAASLFALAQVRGARIGVVAHVSNSAAEDKDAFDTGGSELSFEILQRIVRAARHLLRGG